jgi:hypothetical protein
MLAKLVSTLENFNINIYIGWCVSYSGSRQHLWPYLLTLWWSIWTPFYIFLQGTARSGDVLKMEASHFSEILVNIRLHGVISWETIVFTGPALRTITAQWLCSDKFSTEKHVSDVCVQCRTFSIGCHSFIISNMNLINFNTKKPTSKS